MKNPKERTVECAICGTKFTANGNRAKYCAVCVVEVQRARAREKARLKKEANKIALEDDGLGHVHSCDPPHVQEMCLNCTQETCRGECPAVKAARAKRRWDRADELIALHSEGKVNAEIAEVMGVNYRIVFYHLQKLGLKSNPQKEKI